MDNKAMFNLSYGLFILTAKDGEKDNGCIVNTVGQVTSQPNRISLTVNKANYTHDMILKTKEFNVSVLAENSKFETYRHWGFQSGRNTDKLESISFKRSANGLVYIADETNAFLSAKVVSTLDLGTHTLFIADVTDGEVLSQVPSATYSFYQNNIKPKPASTEKRKGFICREGISVLNPQLNWADKLTNGKGWSYGIDLSFTKEVGSFTGTIGYGLMWNWRKFSQLNHGVKFPAKFDNRHKININAAYKLNEKVEFNAGWTYMTGNRLTLSMYNYDIPGSQFPDAPTVGPPGYGNEIDGIDYYSSRNNVRMPAYHRLDIAININKKLKKGRKAIWNVSLYNAYCHMNAITIQKDNENNVFFTSNKDKWHRAFKTLSFIPTIPSVSYTYIF